MTKRKQKIIDKKFQLKITFSVIGIFFVMIAFIITFIGMNAVKDSRTIDNIIEEQRRIINIQGDALKSAAESQGKTIDIVELKKISDNYQSDVLKINDNMKNLREISHRNNVIILIMIGFFLSLGYILYSILIRKTHKISGPIQIMTRYMRNILEGDYPEMRPLRKDDEFQEFYELFSRVVKRIREDDSKTG